MRRYFVDKILSVAVESTNGCWADGSQGKAWVDASPTAPRDISNAGPVASDVEGESTRTDRETLLNKFR